MFIFFFIGVLTGIYIKETMQIPRLKPYVDKMFSKHEQPETETETEKENAD